LRGTLELAAHGQPYTDRVKGLRSRPGRVRGFGRGVAGLLLMSVALVTAVAYWASRLGYLVIAIAKRRIHRASGKATTPRRTTRVRPAAAAIRRPKILVDFMRKAFYFAAGRRASQIRRMPSFASVLSRGLIALTSGATGSTRSSLSGREGSSLATRAPSTRSLPTTSNALAPETSSTTGWSAYRRSSRDDQVSLLRASCAPPVARQWLEPKSNLRLVSAGRTREREVAL
jgi:hypothetical protein